MIKGGISVSKALSTDMELIKIAREVQQKAYAPYSRFRVGAALLTEEGKIFSGCNVENASYGLTNCAERTAVFKAVSEGYRNFRQLALVGDTDDFCYPCGACRQVLAEFNPQLEVMMINSRGEQKVLTVEQLLPGMFTKDDLKQVQEDAINDK